MLDLTVRQRQVLDAIRILQVEHHYRPSVRELGGLLGMKSPSSVQMHLEALQRKGVLRRRELQSGRWTWDVIA